LADYLREHPEEAALLGNLSNYEPPKSVFGVSGLRIDARYASVGYGADSAIGGEKRSADIYGLNLDYHHDFGRWSLLATLPVSWGSNNSVFSALDNTSLGITVVPRYHVLFPQVDGIALDVDAVLGYRHIWFDDKSKLSGSFGLSDIDDPSSVQAGLLATIGWAKGGFSVAGQVSHVDIRNLANEAAFGSQYSVTNFVLGARQTAGPIQLGLDFSYNWLHNEDPAIDDSYGRVALSAEYPLSGGSSLRLAVDRTLDNANYHATGVMLSYNMRFN